MLIKVRDYILTFWNSKYGKELINKGVKSLILKFFKSAKFGGVKGWLIGLFVEEIILERALNPLIKKIFRELGYNIDVYQGEKLVLKLERAERAGNEDDYNNTVDDIMR